VPWLLTVAPAACRKGFSDLYGLVPRVEPKAEEAKVMSIDFEACTNYVGC